MLILMYTKRFMATLAFLALVPTLMWTYELTEVQDPRSTVSGGAYSSLSWVSWRFDEDLQAEVAFVKGDDHPYLVDTWMFDQKFGSSVEAGVEFLPLSKVPSHIYYDRDFAERLKVGFIIRPPDRPILVKSQKNNHLLVERK